MNDEERDEFLETLAALNFTVAFTFLEIDQLPQEERTTRRLASCLEEAGNTTAEKLSASARRRFLQQIGYVLDSIEDMRFPEDD